MPSIDFTQPATLIAIYGAVVATGALVWTIRKDLRDRGRIAISVAIETRIMVGHDSYDKYPKKTLIRVINKGRRPCTLQEIGFISSPTLFGELARRVFRYNPGHRSSDRNALAAIVPIGDSLPKRIEYEDSWTGEIDWMSLYLVPYGESIAFYAEDTLGRRAFTRRLKVDLFKDPDFENEDDLPYAIDEDLRRQLQSSRDRARAR